MYSKQTIQTRKLFLQKLLQTSYFIKTSVTQQKSSSTKRWYPERALLFKAQRL